MRRHLHIFPPLLCSSARNEIEANTEMRAAESCTWGFAGAPVPSLGMVLQGRLGTGTPCYCALGMKAVLQCTVSICDSEHQRADPQWDTQVMVHPGAMTGHEKECDLERKLLLPPHP